MNITSRQLKAFLLTATYQSFSRAAGELAITQSGMSALVRELEAQLGFRVFERTTRKVTLTEFGAQFLPIAERSLRELESAAANIGRAPSAEADVLCLGATPFMAADVLPPAIARYALREPRLQVRLIDTEPARLVDMLRTGEVHVALSVLNQSAPGVQPQALARYSLMLAAPWAVGLGLPPEVRWGDLVRRRLIGFPPGYPIRDLADEHLRRAGRQAAPEVVCNYLETQLAMVEVAAGVAVVPSLAMQACAKRAISTHRLVGPEVFGNIYWLVNGARALPTGAERFNAYLRDYLAGLSQEPAPRSARAA